MKTKIFPIFGGLLIAAALTFTSYNIWEDQQAGKQAETVLVQVQEQIQEAVTQKAEDDKDTEKEEDPAADPEELSTEQPKVSTVKVDDHNYIGYLEIPVLNLSLPVMDAWNYPKLKIAPCRYKGSIASHDLIIAAHNYSRHFGNLKKLKIGDEIQFTDAAGTSFSYTVVQIEMLDGKASGQMQAGDWDLTLFTCTLNGKNRVSVRCRLL